MKIADKRKLITHIDKLIRALPNLHPSEHNWYAYQMDTPYGILLIDPDTITADNQGIYTIFCRFLEWLEVHPTNPYLSSTSTNKYNLHCMYTDPPETIINKAIHHLTII